ADVARHAHRLGEVRVRDERVHVQRRVGAVFAPGLQGRGGRRGGQGGGGAAQTRAAGGGGESLGRGAVRGRSRLTRPPAPRAARRGARRRRGQVVRRGQRDVHGAGGRVGQEARDLVPREVRAGQHGGGRPDARPHQQPPPQAVDAREVVGPGEERHVVHRGD